MATKEFKMTEDQHEMILKACKPTPVMAIGDPKGGPPIPMGNSQQENADRAWEVLAEELGFVWNTVRPIPFQSDYYFTAEVLNESQSS